MFRKIGFVVCSAFLLLSVGLAHAQQAAPEHSDPYWQVSYWNNRALSGEPVVHDQHAHIDFNWAGGAPHTSVSADRFSARWTRYVDVAAGIYRFTTTSDDGMRVYVDGRPVIDRPETRDDCGHASTQKCAGQSQDALAGQDPAAPGFASGEHDEPGRKLHHCDLSRLQVVQ